MALPPANWTSIGTSFKQQPEEKNSLKRKQRSSSSSSSDSERNERKKRKQKRKKQRKRYSDDEDATQEAAKIVEFEKKRIRIDPRSMPIATNIDMLLSQRDSNSYVDYLYCMTFSDFVLDSKGDRNNLIFGGIYRADIPEYKRFNDENPFLQEVLKWRQKVREYKQQSSLIYKKDAGGIVNTSGIIVEETMAPADRYWKGKYSKKQRDKKLKQVHFTKKFSEELDEYIPRMHVALR